MTISPIEVVEHVPREQKARYFEDLHRIAQPGGLIVLTTPNGRWRGSALPISAEQPVEDWILQTELEMLAKEAGMKILEIGTRGIYRYSSLDRYILTYRLKTILQHFRLWDRYQELLESLGRGITLYAILDVKKE